MIFPQLNKLIIGISVLALAAGLISACQKAVIESESAAAFAALQWPIDAQLYRVQSAQSELRVKVYRQGRLAAMGHNHIVSSNELAGEVYLMADLLATVAEIRLPVNSLEVDRPELRRAAGEEFPGELDDDAVNGTRANMLGEQQLAAANWPWIILRGRALTGSYPAFTLRADLLVQDVVTSVDIPLLIELQGSQLLIHSKFSLLQTELGLEPFSVMMGALRVRDQLDIELTLVATGNAASIAKLR